MNILSKMSVILAHFLCCGANISNSGYPHPAGVIKCILEKGLKNVAKCWRLLLIEIDQYPTLRPPKGSRHASETVVMQV